MALNRGGRKKERKVGSKSERPATCLILTEGTETEVNYFEGIRMIINQRFRVKEIQTNYPMRVQGIGRSTCVLVNEAIKRQSRENYSEVWVVFDKDDNSDFNEAIQLADKNGIKVAWSNESFELWILLHFLDLKTTISREDYIKRLNSYFKTNGINKEGYAKNLTNIFELTKENIDVAIVRSEKLREFYKEQKIYVPEQMNPATTVDMLIKELKQYIG